MADAQKTKSKPKTQTRAQLESQRKAALKQIDATSAMLQKNG
jgi:hypothetical protein